MLKNKENEVRAKVVEDILFENEDILFKAAMSCEDIIRITI